MKIILAILLCLPSCFVCAALQEEFQEILLHNLPNEQVGFQVQDQKTGAILFQHKPFATMHPASNTKLFSMYAALKTLGADYRFKTLLKFDRSQIKNNTLHADVAIEFRGDPTLNFSQYRTLIAQLKEAGIDKIAGNFILNHTTFREPYYAHGWSVDDLAWYYAAPIHGLSFQQNYFSFRILPNKILDKKVEIYPQDSLPFPLTIHSEVRTVRTQDEKNCELSVRQENHTFYFSGCWPMHPETKIIKVANRNVRETVRIALHNLLHEYGIELQGVIAYQHENLATQFTLESPPLKHLVQEVLKNSNNFFAESILKVMGLELHQEGSFAGGLRVVYGVMEEIGIDSDSLKLKDGSGLSQYNLLSANQLSRLLFVISNDAENFPFFQASLPLSGVDGTLKKRMKAFDIATYLHAKTGSLSGHSSLSGYLHTRDNTYIVSLLINNSIFPHNRLKSFEDEVMLWLKDAHLNQSIYTQNR